MLIAPGHVSIAASEAIGVVYGHRGGWVKSDFYDAFVSVRRGLFNTRDRGEHCEQCLSSFLGLSCRLCVISKSWRGKAHQREEKGDELVRAFSNQEVGVDERVRKNV